VTDVQKQLPHGPGGQGVAGSNPVSPTVTSQVRASIRGIGLGPLMCFGGQFKAPERPPGPPTRPTAAGTVGP